MAGMQALHITRNPIWRRRRRRNGLQALVMLSIHSQIGDVGDDNQGVAGAAICCREVRANDGVCGACGASGVYDACGDDGDDGYCDDDGGDGDDDHDGGDDGGGDDGVYGGYCDDEDGVSVRGAGSGESCSSREEIFFCVDGVSWYHRCRLLYRRCSACTHSPASSPCLSALTLSGSPSAASCCYHSASPRSLFLDASSTAPSSRLCAASNAAWHLAVNVVVSSFFGILFYGSSNKKNKNKKERWKVVNLGRDTESTVTTTKRAEEGREL